MRLVRNVRTAMSLVAALAVAGCGGAATDTARPSGPAPATSERATAASTSGAAASWLTVCPANLEMGSPQRVIRILEDGAVVGAEGPIGTLRGDGTFTSVAGDVVRIERDGSVHRPGGDAPALRLRVDETGRATVGERSMELRDDGSVDGASGPGFRIVVRC